MRSHAKAPSAGSTTRRHKLVLGLSAAIVLPLVLGISLASAVAPTVTIDPVDPSKARYTTAHVSGKVDPGDQFTFWSFETSTDGGASWSGFAFHGAFDGATEPGTHDVDFDLTGLQPGTPYEVRLVATNFVDPEAISSVETFETEPVQAPSVSIDPVAAITASSADFSGLVDPNAPKDSTETDEAEEGAFQSSWNFDCVPDCGFLSGEPIAADDDPAPVTAQATGLEPNTEYTVTLHASNAGGTNEASASFTTEPAAPAIDSLSVEDVTSEDATLKAKLNPGGAATSWRFEWVTEAEFEANGFANADKAPVPDAAAGAGKAAVAISEAITGLDPATRYRFRVIATNLVDTTESADKAFKTFAPAKSPQQGTFPGQGFLPDNRAWELVSPPNKLGNDVLVSSSRIRAAEDGSAVSFASLGGFADVAGGGIETEYIAQRTAASATNGWAIHGITPRQESLSFAGAAAELTPGYKGEFSADLNKGIFRAWSPLTDAPNVAPINNNLYLRDDLRSPGPGAYHLLSDANDQLQPSNPTVSSPRWMFLDDTSDDLEHAIFTSQHPFRSSADGENFKVYKSYGPGVPRLIAVGPNCPAAGNVPGLPPTVPPATPCGVVGSGGTDTSYAMSGDGSRVEFTSPVRGNSGALIETPGAVSRLFQFDDRGTDITMDDVTIQVNGSERSSPQFSKPAIFQSASADGDRVFFSSAEPLTDAPGSGLYMWDRQEEDEVQRVAVDAEGGTFTLTAHTQPTLGRGNLTESSGEVTGVDAGSFLIGQTVTAPGIPPGTKIVGMGSFQGGSQSFLTLSDEATETASGVEIAANVEATTPPLPFDASAAEVDSALEALTDDEGRRLLGTGNVAVGGGPGGSGAANPYDVTFTGALGGVNVMELDVDGSSLSGGAAAADVSTTNAVQNLTLPAPVPAILTGVYAVFKTSDDGHRVYFTAAEQLVQGGPFVSLDALYYWQDADGTPGGTLSFIGEIRGPGDLFSISALLRGREEVTGITPSGRHLIFAASHGSGLAPAYDHSVGSCRGNNANHEPLGGCSEIYLYRADSSTPTEPDLICVSCNPSGAPAIASAWLGRLVGAGASSMTNHVNNFLSDDGRYVFFSSGEKLVPEDINGLEDAYVYDTLAEEPRLLSSGESSAPSYFAEATPDGKDAFILTSERLSGWDVDGNIDLYDARVGGGLPEPPPPPPSCQGDACQPAPSSLNDPTPASSAFSGPGDASRPRKPRCGKGQRKVRRAGKTRCVKRKAKGNRKRAAGKNRRAGR